MKQTMLPDHCLATFRVGKEIEHSPAHGLTTLFVIGLQKVEAIEKFTAESQIQHIYFGANQSYNLSNFETWNQVIEHFLKKGYLCTLDFDVTYISEIVETSLIEYNNFIPKISVKIPYISLLNYNTCVKIDDVGFGESNPGVWVHRLHNLMDGGQFTHCREYFEV